MALEFQPTFVPTDFSSLSRLAGMYTQNLAGKDRMFEQGMAMENQFLSELYGQDTYSPEAMNTHIGRFAEKMQKVVDRYGGDYGAAAKDIAKLGAREMSNPVYKFNKAQVEQANLLSKMKAANPTLLVLENPAEVDLNKVSSIEELQPVVADPANIQKSLMDLKGNLARMKRQGTPVMDPVTGYWRIPTTTGPTDEEIGQMRQDPELKSAILARNPQIAPYLDRPDVAQWLDSQVAQGLKGLQGGTDYDMVRPLTGGSSSISRADMAKQLAKVAGLTVTSNRAVNNQAYPFTKVKDLYNTEKGTVEEAKATAVKDQARYALTSPEVTADAEKNNTILSYVGSKNSGKDLEGIDELTEVTPLIPGLGNVLSKELDNVSKIGSLMGAISKAGLLLNQPKMLYHGAKNLLGFTSDNYKEALQNNMKSVDEKVKGLKDYTLSHPGVILHNYLNHRKDTFEKYDLDKLPKEDRKNFLLEVNRLQSKSNNLMSDLIGQNFGDYTQGFLSRRESVGDADIDKELQAMNNNINKQFYQYTQGDIANSIEIIQSSNENIKDLDKFKEKDPKGYGKIQTTMTDLEGAVVDTNLGPIFQTSTESESGLDHHIIRVKGRDKVLELLSLYGQDNMLATDRFGRPIYEKERDEKGNIVYDKKGNPILLKDEEGNPIPVITDLFKQAQAFYLKEDLKSEYGNNLDNLPGYKEFSGGTIKDYLNFLMDNPNISQENKAKVTVFLRDVTEAPDTTKIK